MHNLNSTGNITLSSDNSSIIHSGSTKLSISSSSGSVDIESVNFDGQNISNISSLTAATLTGSISTASQPNITSLGTLTSLAVDNISVDGNLISSSSGNINITLNTGSVIVLDDTIIDAGVITGATSITSTDFSGSLTGDFTGNVNIGSSNTLKIDNTTVTSSASEINKLTGLTATTDELNYLDINTIGVSQDNKVLTQNSSGLVSIESSTPELRIKSTSISDGAALLTLMSDNLDEAGDTFQFKSLNGTLTLLSDNNTAGTLDETIMTITGSDVDANKSVNITGDLTASTISMSDSNKINVGSDNDMTIYHDGTDSYITNKTGSMKIATETSGVPIRIGHSISEVTIGDNMTVDGNIVITGNLTVNGSSTTSSSTSTIIQDKLIKLGDGNDSQSQDIGIIFTRGDGSVTNKTNRGFIWDESDDLFALINCNEEDGTTDGNVVINDYSDLKIKNLTVTGSISNGTYNFDSNSNVSGLIHYQCLIIKR